MPPVESQWADIQGNILRPYSHSFARYTIVRVEEAAGARHLLAGLLNDGLITTAERWNPGEKPSATLNIYISWHGLAALGLPTAALDSFPVEFRAGMAARAELLGDSPPSTWEVGADPEQTHVFFAVYGNTETDVEAMLDNLRARLGLVAGAVTVTHRQKAAMLSQHTEHFGFADGFSQPQVLGSGAPEYRGDGTPLGENDWKAIATGEFILGYKNETGNQGPMLSPISLGHNGSFMAYRKIEQNVPEFRAFLRQQAELLFGSASPENLELLAAKMVGRWRSGCPLSLSPDRDNPALADQWNVNNDFRYRSDARGAICPLGSHIRRMNPRDGLPADSATQVNTHRIIRRGMPYGDWLEDGQEDDQKRGIAFIAVNASLAYQFELVQRDWNNSGEFAGLDAQDVDIFTGVRRPGARFRIPQVTGAPKRIFNLPEFTKLRGGGYFFIPSLTALRLIATLPV